MSRSGSSRTSSAKQSAALTESSSVYDAPLAVLDAKASARKLAEHPDQAVADQARAIMDLLTRAIRQMAGVDLGDPAAIEAARVAYEGQG